VISIVDTTEVDAPSITVLKQEITGVRTLSYSLFFALDVGSSLALGRSYSVAVLIDVDGSRSVTTGDLITTQSYPVTGTSDPMFISVKTIR
jgi:hypothetical protein